MDGTRYPGSFYFPSVLLCLQGAAWAWGLTMHPYLVQGNDEEGPPTSALSHNRNEVGVHGTEVIVVDTVGDGHRVIAVLLAGWFAKNVAELGAPVLGVP